MDAHYAINIGRQIGSGGRAVAKILSEELGINQSGETSKTKRILLRGVSAARVEEVVGACVSS